MAPPIVKRYLLALSRHKWVGLTGFLVVTGLSGVAAVLQPPPSSSYLSQGILTYNAPPDTFSQTGTALRQQGETMTKDMLMSTYVVGRALQRLEAEGVEISVEAIRLGAKVTTNNDKTGKEEEAAKESEGAAAPLRVLVSFSDKDQKRSEAIVAALMEAMAEQSRQFNLQQMSNIIDNLNQLLPKVTQELRSAEQRLQDFIRLEGTAIQTAESGALVGAITGSQSQQREIQMQLAGIEAQMASLQSRLGLTAEEAYTSSALSADPIIADLRAKIYQAEAQIDLLKKTLRPEHPSIVEINNQLAVYEQLLQQRVAEVIGGGAAAPLQASSQIRQASSLDPSRQQLAAALVGLETERATLQQQLANLRRSEQSLRQEYTSIPNKQLEQQRLEQQVVLKRSFYDQIQARLADATLAQQETVGSLVMVQEPKSELQTQAGPNSLVIFIIGGVIGLVVGGGLVLLLDAIDPRIYTLEDLQTLLRDQDVPVLGLLPSLPWADETEHLAVISAANTGYIEPYERLRSNLRRVGGKALKMLLITSLVREEGKSDTAYNLAIASARAGKRTLLIEADLRSASQAQSLNITLDPDSQVEPLRYYGNLNDCIRLAADVENLYVVPSAGPQRQAAAVLESSEMRRLIEEGRVRFDLVILDTPPLSRYNDALLLEPYTDGLILVTRPGFSESSLLNEAAEQFMEGEDIKFLGAIINDADMPIQIREVIDAVEDSEQEEKQTVEEVGAGSRNGF